MAPPPDAQAARDTDVDADAMRRTFVETATRLAELGAENFNNGIRAYYFSMALMAWFIHPAMAMAATLALTVMLYQREFSSPTLRALRPLADRMTRTSSR
jgi:uncharacterized membrane protein